MSYTDIAYCDTVLTSAEWIAATTAEKQTAIDTGELWIDKYYSCTAGNPVQAEIQKGNAMLADMYVKNEMFASSSSSSSTSQKKVKVGPIEISTTYDGGGKTTENKFAEIDFLLGVACPVNPAAASAITIVRA